MGIIFGIVLGIAMLKFVEARNDYSVRGRNACTFWGVLLAVLLIALMMFTIADYAEAVELQRIEHLLNTIEIFCI